MKSPISGQQLVVIYSLCRRTVSVIAHADWAGPMRDYCLDLIMPCERKSVEPMAAVTAPDRTAAVHQSLLHFVGQSP
jgi:SRSO17 transposase